MSTLLPLFPLRTVLFPGRPLPLHVFEDRYRALLSDCLETDRRFGVVAIRCGQEVGQQAEVFDVGTIAEIEGVEHHEDGRADVTTRGTERFRIREIVETGPYLQARIEQLTEPELPPARGNGQLARSCEALRQLLHPYLAELGAPDELLVRLPRDPGELSWLAAAAVQVDLAERQRLLELDSVDERILETARILRRETTIMRHLGTVASLNPPGPGGAELN
ncbi:peptidase S16 [Egibacter rhizosphaerae]|uniref:Peptidase S16 n=1 Tax=Egibacter rhizosphaerae TaxID=1670831 RepID=A0A411YKT9_9ACTN|nr:LON peptidase substrate-binding domain-containing protein [Egibacter rhizosphaerae]QBI21812.1 peptidase S16 [Egibacter rhizosphaerae]